MIFTLVHSPVLLQLMSELEDWTLPIRSFQRNLEKALSGDLRGKRTVEQELQHLGIVVDNQPQSISSETLLLQQHLVALSRILRHSTSASVNTVLANIELAGCGMAWFTNENWGTTEDTAGLANIMKE